MPDIGDIRRRGNYSALVWSACVDCGLERWVDGIGLEPRFELCRSCASKKSREPVGERDGLIVVGDIVNGRAIGRRDRDKFMWHSCEKCTTERWVKVVRGEARSPLCLPCSHELSRKYGPKQTWNRYNLVYIPLDSPYRNMTEAHSSRIREHRLVMAEHLGRCLESWEIVHHINGDRTDNRLGNLELVSVQEHQTITILQNKVRQLEIENAKLRGGGNRG